MRLMETENLQPGMVLANQVYSRGGTTLLKKGVVLKPSYINRLKFMDIPCVYIYDELPKEVVTGEVIDRKHLMNAYNIMREKNYDLCLAIASCIVEDLLDHIDDIPNMKQLQLYDNATFNHSIHVAVLSTLVGLELGFYEERLDKLALSGLMHDIGKEKLPEEIIKKEGKLTDQEYRLVQEHPRLGYEMVKDRIGIPAVVKNAILFHHENEDGSGYSEGRTGDQVHMFAKIVHLCDVYDAMVSKRCYKKDINPAWVIAYLKSEAGIMFDEMLVDAFRSSVFPYTPGVLVKLSDGRKAVVKENHRGYPDRPDVVLEDSGLVLELRHIHGLFIAKILTGEQQKSEREEAV